LIYISISIPFYFLYTLIQQHNNKNNQPVFVQTNNIIMDCVGDTPQLSDEVFKVQQDGM